MHITKLEFAVKKPSIHTCIFCTFIILVMGICFISCSLDQGAGHTISFRMPVFSSSVERSSTITRSKVNNTEQYFLSSIPPIVGWNEEVFFPHTGTIQIPFLDRELACTYEMQEDQVMVTGVDEYIDLAFTISADGAFSYHAVQLSSNDEKALIASTVTGVIDDDFIDEGEGTVKIWTVTENSELSESLIYLTFDVSLNAGVPVIDEMMMDNSEPEDPNVESLEHITIDLWEESIEELFDAFPSETSAPFQESTYNRIDGMWASVEK